MEIKKKKLLELKNTNPLSAMQTKQLKGGAGGGGITHDIIVWPAS